MSRARNSYRLASYWQTGQPARVVDPQSEAEIEELQASTEGAPIDALRHGYTLADIEQLAKSAAANNHTMAADHRDLHYAAWSAIIDLLYANDTPPSRHDLAYAGKAAIWQLVRDHRRTYGYADRDWYNGLGSAPRFASYWHQPAEAPHEERYVEETAVRQIFATLTDRQREVLLAAAAHDGDYVAAAEALKMPRGSYSTWLSLARRAVAEAWHAPETPHRPAGRPGTFNRRKHRGEVAPCGTLSAVHRHRGRKEPLCELCAPIGTAYERERKARRKKPPTPPAEVSTCGGEAA
jgi:DNA-directed RNA polymerase specialized sigma24 family protein